MSIDRDARSAAGVALAAALVTFLLFVAMLIAAAPRRYVDNGNGAQNVRIDRIERALHATTTTTSTSVPATTTSFVPAVNRELAQLKASCGAGYVLTVARDGTVSGRCL